MGDLINRDYASQAIEAYLCSQCDRNHNKECYACPHLSGNEILSTVPTAGMVKHGRWEDNKSKQRLYYPYKCSVCNEVNEYPFPYCPICGARMDAEDINVLTSDGGAENG